MIEGNQLGGRRRTQRILRLWPTTIAQPHLEHDVITHHAHFWYSSCFVHMHADVQEAAASSQHEWYKKCNILRIAKSGRDTRTYTDLSTSLASHFPGSVLELPVLELPILGFTLESFRT